MNKLFTKITSLALGAAMMIGVGVAVSSKNVSAAHADNSMILDATAFELTSTALSSATDKTVGTTTFKVPKGTKSQGKGASTSNHFSTNATILMTSGSALYNTTALPGNITKFEIWLNGGSPSTGSSATMYYSDSVISTTPSSGGNTTAINAKDTVFDVSKGCTGYKYFRYVVVSKNVQCQIKITYSSDPASLAAPTGISYNSTTQKVTWNAVTGATGYQYTLDNGSTWTAVTSFAERYLSVGSWTDGDYNLKLRANGNGTDYVTNGTASDNYAFTKQESPTYTGVTVTPGSLVGNEKGTAYIDLTATVQGTHSPSQVVSWKITSDTTYVDQTSISGKASIASTGDSTGRVTFDDNFTGYAWAVAADGTTKNYAQVVASGLIDAKGSQNNPYTVAEARAAIDNSGAVTGVYAKGIVSSIVTAYSTQYKNVTYNLSDDGTTTANQLETYRLSAEADPGVKVGDVITVTGNLTKYGTTYEFGSACTLYRHAQIQSLTVATSPDNEYDAGETFNPAGLVVSAAYNNGESNHSFSYANHQSNFGFDPDTSTSLTSTDEAVTITYGNGEVSFPIEVTVAPAVISVEVDPSSKTAYFEDEFNINASVTTEGGASAAITWSIEDNSSLISIKNGTATDTSVTIVAGTTVGTAYVRATSNFNNQVYARCKVDVKDPNALVDTITYELIGVTGTSYTDWSGKTDSTSAVYFGKTAGGNTSIQFNVTSSNKGFLANSATAGYVRSVQIAFNSSCSSNRTLTLYGSTTPFASYNEVVAGTVLGSVSSSASGSETISVASTDNYAYFGLVGTGGASYVDEIIITYEKILPSISLTGSSFSFDEGETGNISVTATASNFTDNNSVVFTAESGDQSVLDDGDISVSGGTVSIDKTKVNPGTVTITVTGTYEAKSESATAEFTVTCVASSRSLESIEITTASRDTVFVVNDTFTITDLVVTGHFDSAPLTEDVTSTCTFKLWNGSSETTLNPGSSTLGTAGQFTIRISHSQSEAAETLTYTIRVDEIPVYSETAFSSLYEGAKVLIVCKGSEKAVGSYGSSIYSSVDVTIDENTGNITDWGTAIEFTVRIYGERVAFEYDEGKYIGYNGSGNNAHEQSALVEKATWTFDDTHGLLSSTSERYLQYNAQSPRFACYTGGQSDVSIYINSNSSKTDVLEAQSFQYKYLHMRDYLGEEGSDGDGYCRNTGDGDGKNYFADAVTYYSSNSMSADARVKFGTTSDFAKARKRLIDWGKANSKNVAFDATTGDITVTQIGMSLINNIFATSESTATTFIIIISVIGVSALGGFFFLRKRKEI